MMSTSMFDRSETYRRRLKKLDHASRRLLLFGGNLYFGDMRPDELLLYKNYGAEFDSKEIEQARADRSKGINTLRLVWVLIPEYGWLDIRVIRKIHREPIKIPMHILVTKYDPAFCLGKPDPAAYYLANHAAA